MLSNGFENIMQNTLNNCSTIDYYYSKFANSSPHYMGLMGNFLIQKSMEQSVSLSLKSVSLLVSVSENVIDFMIDLWLGTWVCLVVSAIDGSVDVATNATESIIDLVNGTVRSVADEIDDGLSGLTTVVNKVLSVASSVKDFLNGNDDGSDIEDQVKKVNLTINGLRSLSIPSSIDDKLVKLSADTPDFDTVKNKTKQAIAVPFNIIRNEIKTINASKLVGDPRYLEVPPVNTSSAQICSDNKPEIEEVFVTIQKVFASCTIAILIISIFAALFLMMYKAWAEWRQWKRLELFRDQCRHQSAMLRNPFDDPSGEKAAENIDALETYHLVFNRYQSGFGRWLSRRSSSDLHTQRNVQWLVSYMTSSTSLTLLALGICGIILCCVQFAIIAFVREKINGKETENIMTKMSTAMSDSFSQDITTWSKSTNLYINDTETQINKQVFGWIQNTTDTVNGTVTDLLNDIDSTISKAFNGTILYNPMDTVMQCVIGNKLEAISKGLTWVHNTAQVNIPRVNGTEIYQQLQGQQSISSNGTSNVTQTSSSSSIASEIKESIIKAANKILSQYKYTVVTELIVSCVFLALYLLQFVTAGLFLTVRRHVPRQKVPRT
ncbi:unnamed protein product [Kluyveromyces dobzhanskii CBS 2104]|uniref:Plasma membrane fusion protein PRM1 n=1 Tax=Kluyveromyces dobzhanskii CBS 2104 TaxID=1427455 RepID=A0A0A8L167_9SACH|nr:unnamed protein product [Kluyveromyces dobzhanskii CBS 2104]